MLKKFVALMLLIFIVVRMYGNVIPIHSDHEFKQAIAHSTIALVMFYFKGENERKDKKIHRLIEQLENTFETVSNSTRYKRAEIAFMKINSAHPALKNCALRYGIKKLPAFVLFERGIVMLDGENYPIVLTGFVDRAALKDFIEAHSRSHIKNILQEKEVVANRRKREDRSAWVPYYYPYDYYYPYVDFEDYESPASPNIRNYNRHER
jgi:hypothetical protein